MATRTIKNPVKKIKRGAPEKPFAKRVGPMLTYLTNEQNDYIISKFQSHTLALKTLVPDRLKK